MGLFIRHQSDPCFFGYCRQGIVRRSFQRVSGQGVTTEKEKAQLSSDKNDKKRRGDEMIVGWTGNEGCGRVEPLSPLLVVIITFLLLSWRRVCFRWMRHWALLRFLGRQMFVCLRLFVWGVEGWTWAWMVSCFHPLLCPVTLSLFLVILPLSLSLALSRPPSLRLWTPDFFLVVFCLVDKTFLFHAFTPWFPIHSFTYILLFQLLHGYHKDCASATPFFLCRCKTMDTVLFTLSTHRWAEYRNHIMISSISRPGVRPAHLPVLSPLLVCHNIGSTAGQRSL